MRKWASRLFDFHRIPAVFWIVAITSGAGLLFRLFQWQLVQMLSVFIMPILGLLVFGAFAGALIGAIAHAIHPFRGARPHRFTPLLLALVALATFIFFPFTEIYLKIDFALYLHDRTAVAEQILRSKPPESPMLWGRGDVVSLPGLSDDGEGMYWHTREKQMVFFFTFRGILDHFSGFVYSATDAPPQDNDFGGKFIEIKHLRKNWYWVASD